MIDQGIAALRPRKEDTFSMNDLNASHRISSNEIGMFSLAVLPVSFHEGTSHWKPCAVSENCRAGDVVSNVYNTMVYSCGNNDKRTNGIKNTLGSKLNTSILEQARLKKRCFGGNNLSITSLAINHKSHGPEMIVDEIFEALAKLWRVYIPHCCKPDWRYDTDSNSVPSLWYASYVNAFPTSIIGSFILGASARQAKGPCVPRLSIVHFGETNLVLEFGLIGLTSSRYSDESSSSYSGTRHVTFLFAITESAISIHSCSVSFRYTSDA